MYEAKLGKAINEKLDIPCIYNDKVLELMRGVRQNLETLLGGATENDLRVMRLGLAHSLGRHKLKFSPDKVDTMIVQVRHPPVILSLPRPPTPLHLSPTCYYAHEQLPPHTCAMGANHTRIFLP